MPLDVTDSGSVETAAERIESELGPVDVLVNNAGWDEARPFLETDERFWDRVIEINFKGGLRPRGPSSPAWSSAAGDVVVNIGSDAGRVGSSMESVYSGAKGGLIAFTKTIAREVARSGVTANAVCPGPTRTAFLERIAGEGGERLVDSSPAPCRCAAWASRRTWRPPSPSSPRRRPATSPARRYP